MTSRSPLFFVFDLDGVIRRWDPGIVARAEHDHRLAFGALLNVAFEPELLDRVVTGIISDRDWRTEVAARLLHHFPDADGVGAVAAWSDPVGELHEGTIEVLQRARRRGQVCLLTNATDRLASDLQALGIGQAFDHVFNSSEIGYAKPDVRIYKDVERALNVPPSRIVYVDDSSVNIEVAAARGWTSLLASPENSLPRLICSFLN